jgi:hypothetical protein
VSVWSSWDVVRRRGRTRFLLVNGLLIRGVPMAAAWAIAMWAFGQGELELLLTRALLFFPLLGVLAAAVLWWRAERSYAAKNVAGNP